MSVNGRDELIGLLGAGDRHARAVRDGFGVNIFAKGGEVKIVGQALKVEKALRVLDRMLVRVRDEGWIPVDAVADLVAEEGETGVRQATTPGDPGVEFIERRRPRDLEVSRRGAKFGPRSGGQGEYIEAIRHHDITFCIGPAGTGKTYIAVAMAVEALRGGRVRRIVLARPAVEAGERLGFLPGDIQAKVNPYLRPLYDGLNAILDTGQLKKLLDAEIVEIVPLAYMRGRTLDDAFIILDEAQNTTQEQMKMFLTRMGTGSKIVVTGDVTQVDLPTGKTSGLLEAQSILPPVGGIAFQYLTRADIVRHPLVQKIVDAYERKDAAVARKKQARR
ncbi:MAG: PhoH family protein [Candidatus Brocadiae bacterium]|nr:PhoH family protein [Candidatus Brocadiia bacterium]